MRELSEIRVTWQMAIVIGSLAFIPICMAPLLSVLGQPDQTGASGVRVICISLVVASLALSVVAVYSRLLAVKQVADRQVIIAKLGWGLLCIAAGILVAVLIARSGDLPRTSHWYAVPMAFYLLGIRLIARAMVIQKT